MLEKIGKLQHYQKRSNMEATVENRAALKGAEFLVRESAPEEVFTPEDFSEEQLMIKEMADQFISKEITPIVERID